MQKIKYNGDVKKAAYLLALFLCLPLCCFGWWDTGHMTIAKIAYNRLTPKAKAEVGPLIDLFAKDFPESSQFPTAACFADDISDKGIRAFHSWHGSALPYDPEGLLSEKQIEASLAKLEGNDLIWAIENSISTLRSEKASLWTKAFMLRFLLHFVGDIHQPLHCTTFYSKGFPNGDRAGTRFPIQSPLNTARSLHTFWDSICGMDVDRLNRPLSTADEERLDLLCLKITDLFPLESLPEASCIDPYAWRAESHNWAKCVAYQNVFPNQILTEEYIAKSQEVAQRQIALAGYRLANLLNSIFE